LGEATRVLVVDDEESLRHMLSLSLSRDGFHVWTAASGKEALDVLRSGEPFDICLTDVRMPGMDGLAFIEDAVRLGDKAPTFIAMSAYGDEKLAVEALRRGAFDYLSKPFPPEELTLKLRLVVERRRLGRAGERAGRGGGPSAPRGTGASSTGKLPGGLDEIVSVAPAMLAVFRTVKKVAPFPSTVLITGETGTGKERVAGALHRESQRASRPFVAVNCGAIPESLLESELFGHVKGAFTDAHGDRAGLFETAHGGTLFLDEIAELPLLLQVKLLRALVEREIRRVGDSRTIPVDVRLIAATSKNLPQMVRDGSFREDLFYRLNVVSIQLPPLRERREDIPVLARHFVRLLGTRLGLEGADISPDALALLERYPWPGNVRELENAIERAMVLSESGGRIGVLELDDRFDDCDEEDAPEPATAAAATEELSLKVMLPRLERQLIQRALEQTGGNRTRAAVLLGISHRALLYKLKDYGIA
jgi:two-component system response regulator AtoC